MIKFERLEGPFGIPIFHQQLPDVVRSSSIALAVFIGSADDTSVGEPGLYHWFEHVPFRGTKKFPGGYAATKGPISRVAGSIGAWTGMFCTNYWTTVPTRRLQTAAEILVDLVAQPLLTEEAIVAEREIINQEIRDKMGSDGGNMSYKLPSILWGEHPFRSHTLGSIESLSLMTPDLLAKARSVGYDRSRMVFFASTYLTASEVLDMFADLFETLPSNGVSERRTSISFGPLPWEKGKKTVFSTDFSSSIVKVLFSAPSLRNKRDLAKGIILKALFSHGGPGAPLYRAVRENNPLAYNAFVDGFNCLDGGYWGFQVKTSASNVDAVLEALPTMLLDPQLRSKTWFEDIKEAARSSIEMEIIDPGELVQGAVAETIMLGEPVDDEEVIQLVLDLSHQEILGWLNTIEFEEARTVISLGKG